MAMFLNGVNDTTIKKMGRWSSDTFLVYIHSQIARFSNEVSAKMATPAEFHNVAAPVPVPQTVYAAISKTPCLIALPAA